MTKFYEATQKFGVPSSVQSDKRRENILICYYMVFARGTGRGSHIAEPSTRIERDVNVHGIFNPDEADFDLMHGFVLFIPSAS